MSTHKHFINRLVLVILAMLLAETSQAQAQGRFLLTEAEMSGYVLKRQSVFGWTTGEDGQHHEVIEQKWEFNVDGQKKYLNIQYCEFENEITAIKGTAFASRTFATPFRWDSPNGSIFGDGAWHSISGGALFFVRGNVGIKVHVDDQQTLVSISDKLLDKIETNLSPEILAFEETARQRQIPTNIFHTIVDPVVNSELLSGFSPYSTWDSKWLSDSETLTMGIREEWKSATGAITSIDICKYDGETSAFNASTIRGKHIPTSRIYDLAKLDSLKTLIQHFKNSNNQKIAYGMLGVKGNITIHYYHFNPDSIDWDLFYSIVEAVSEEIINF